MNSPSQIGNIVLPALPPQPNLHKFPTLNLAEDTLPGHNASLQSFMASDAPRPSAAFLPKLPVITTEEGIQRIKNNYKALQEWKNIFHLIPKNFAIFETGTFPLILVNIYLINNLYLLI